MSVIIFGHLGRVRTECLAAIIAIIRISVGTIERALQSLTHTLATPFDIFRSDPAQAVFVVVLHRAILIVLRWTLETM